MYKPFVIFVIIFGVVTGTLAQDVDCVPDLSSVDTIIDDAISALDDGDLDTALELIAEARTDLEEIEAECTSFTPYYVTSNTRVNLRSCGASTCDVVTTAGFGEELQVVDNTGDWYKVRLDDGSTGYIAAFLVSENPPAVQAAQSVVQPTQPSAPIQATAIPQQVQQPTAVPVQPTAVPVQPTQPPAPAFTCDCSKTCGQMASCEEAYYQLQQCGCGKRDNDNDGVPCESICPGG